MNFLADVYYGLKSFVIDSDICPRRVIRALSLELEWVLTPLKDNDEPQPPPQGMHPCIVCGKPVDTGLYACGQCMKRIKVKNRRSG